MTREPDISILVVEDETVVALDIAQSLERLGYTIAGTTTRGEEAIELAGHVRPDLVLMDIRLAGDLDGIEAAEVFQRAYGIPVVYLTAHSDEATLRRAQVTSPFGYLLKPFEDRELQVAVATALERHRLESDLRDREEQLDAILRGIGETVVATDHEDRITFLNPAGEALLQVTADETRGRPVDEIVRMSHDERGRNLLLRGDEAIAVEASRSVIRDARGAATGHLRVLRDISESIRAQDERERLEAAKTQFFANASHDLRTPLTLILGPCDRVLASDRLADAERDDLRVIQRNARTLLGYVEDLLNISRMAAGTLELGYERTDIAALVRLVAANFETLASQQELQYRVDAPHTVFAEIDAEKMQRVAINLLSNAIRHTPRGGSVRISLAEENDAVVLEVADSGPGVPPDERARIFERYYQAIGTRAAPPLGAGLGLAIVHDFVTLHGGTIAVEAAPEGGALFRVRIPIRAPAGVEIASPGTSAVDRVATTQSAALEPPVAGAPSASLPSEHVGDGPVALVVEDNVEMSQFIADSLRNALGFDCRVERAYDGRQGLDKALAQPPDLIISDIMMPELDGDQLVEEIRRHDALDDVPILLVTAKADDELRVRLLREGAQDYLIKPFSPAELGARAANLFAVRRTRRVLQDSLETQMHDVEGLARQLAGRKLELQTALDSMRVAREHAESASAIKTRFLGLVSHELRTPIATIQLQVERLLVEHAGGGAAIKPASLQRINASATRLQELVESLLHYSRLQSGKLKVKVERFSLKEVADEAVREIGPHAEAKALSLELREEAPLPPLRSDPDLVRLILVNLLGNAVKFTERGGVVVSLTCVRHEGRAHHRLAVTDTGPGIGPERRTRVFEAFQQEEGLSRKHATGVGLGLTLVREMVSSLGGIVMLDSEVGVGSTFAVFLPDLEGREAAQVNSSTCGD